MNVTPVLRILFVVRLDVRNHLKAKLDLVDWDRVLTRIVLQRPREEGLSKEESTDPVVARCSLLLVEKEFCVKICSICKCFQE